MPPETSTEANQTGASAPLKVFLKAENLAPSSELIMKEFVYIIRQDWARNRKYIKSLLVIMAFRIAHSIAIHKGSSGWVWWLGLPYIIFYRLLTEWFLGIELPAKTQVGPGLIIHHGQGLVINPNTRIGRNVVLRQNTSIGTKFDRGPSPEIGDNVNVGANVVVIGDIIVGDDAIIGAGSVVVKDVPQKATVVGNPARVVSKYQSTRD